MDLWDRTRKRYDDEYDLTKPNDLVLLGAILSQQMILMRAQQALNGMHPIVDAAGVPTGQYRFEALKPQKTREAGGTHTIVSYLTELKLAGGQMGVHISKRVIAYEQFCMDLRWRLRLLEVGDEEDRNYHDISEEKLIEWMKRELASLEEVDKKFARERGKVWVGRL
jgi:hypothetical protein